MPGRRHYFFAACGALAVAVYGSLVPLHYTPRAFEDALAAFRQVPYLSLGAGSRADWVSNILLFVPLGYLWLGVVTLDSRRSWLRVASAVVVVCVLAAIAIGIEFTQLWFPPRTVSQNDIIAESIGGAAGALLWLATGQATAEWLRTIARTRRQADRIQQMLQLYFIGYALYAVLPLDLTISSGELLDKLRQGRLVLLPFGDVRPDLDSLWGLIRDVALFFPIGILLSTWRTTRQQRVRSIAMTTALGTVVAGVIELAQVFIYSRYATTTDVLVSAITAGAAGFVAQRWWGDTGGLSAAPARPGRHGLRWVIAATIWAVILFVIFCTPFEVSGTSAEWRARYEGIWSVPFASLYYSPEYIALSNVLRKLLLFGVLGALATMARRAWMLPPMIDRLCAVAIVMAGTGVALAIEIAQVVLPPHVPDITDVAFGMLGTLFGAIVTNRLTAPGVPPAPSRNHGLRK